MLDAVLELWPRTAEAEAEAEAKPDHFSAIQESTKGEKKMMKIDGPADCMKFAADVVAGKQVNARKWHLSSVLKTCLEICGLYTLFWGFRTMLTFSLFPLVGCSDALSNYTTKYEPAEAAEGDSG